MPQEPVIVYGFDKSYAPYAAVSTYSLFQSAINGAKVYWIIHKEDASVVYQLVDILNKAVGAQIKLVITEGNLFSNWKNMHEITKFISNATYIRFLIPQYIEENRVIYLDADTIVLSDIGELYSLAMEDNVIAGVADITGGTSTKIERDPNDTYINAGMIVMDLEALRRDDFLQKCIRIRERFLDQIVWNDQCIINKYAENRKLILDPRWNRQILPYSYKAAQFKQISSRENSSILHFIGSLKPWQGWCNPPVAEFWWNYANRLNIKDFAPQPITTVDQALTLAGSLDINEMYRESSTVKGNIINSLMNILNSRE